ncbi:MAG: iron ABC transporter permease [Alphaproteobacteria bacterium]|nr:iron ABC transporter permease [Alphaproteobacteria bacterium]
MASGLQSSLRTGLGRASGQGRWTLAACIIAAMVAAPVLALIVIAARGSGDLWPHLLRTVIPATAIDTLLLLTGVGVIVMSVGTSLAWLLTAYEFPGRRIFDWALLLPLAVPTYIVAYAYLDLLHPIGPLQSGLRALLGISDPRGLWFPEVRSMSGCIILLGFVLYPYVYLSTRAMFLMQAGSILEVARTLGANRSRVFFKVALPLARPAIAVGTALALMEALNDIGASEFLGVQTLSVSIYATWINRSNLPGAAQIALFMLLIVVSLVFIERWARRDQRYVSMAQRARRAAPRRLRGWRAGAAIALASIPVLIGFLLPAVFLAFQAWERISFAGLSDTIPREIVNTMSFAAMATAIALALGFIVAYAARLSRGALPAAALRVSSLGYAIPGTVLAIGMLAPLAAVDNFLGDMLERFAGIAPGLLLTGSGAALILAYAIRFMAISAGSVESGLAKLSPSLDHASRTMGETAGGTIRRVHLPLLRPALGAAALLIFVDCMKELPATLLLRPLNFETLATHLYAEASRGAYEDGSIVALCIVLFGLIPVILLAKLSRRPALAHDSANAPGRDVLLPGVLPGDAQPPLTPHIHERAER